MKDANDPMSTDSFLLYPSAIAPVGISNKNVNIPKTVNTVAICVNVSPISLKYTIIKGIITERSTCENFAM